MKHRYVGTVQITYPDRVVVHENVAITLDKAYDCDTAALALIREFKDGLNTSGVYSATVKEDCQ